MNPDLAEILAAAQRRGWIGRAPMEDQLRHAGAFAQCLGEGPGVVVDLGSGGGLPALPAALEQPAWRWVLVEAQLRRAQHLGGAVVRLGLGTRVSVHHARAEDLGRAPTLRGTASTVTARSFGPPAVVAECAAPLLRAGGRVVVSEPPGPSDRWPAAGLAVLGLALVERVVLAGASFAVLQQQGPCPSRYPRRAGRPAAAPLFGGS